jgi:hypothetical protein
MTTLIRRLLMVVPAARVRPTPAAATPATRVPNRSRRTASSTTVRGHPGWIGRDQVFWLVRTGLAVSVHVDRTRWSRHDLRRIAWSA